MTKDEIQKLVVSKLEEIQTLSGREVPELANSTRPLIDLEGFDSLNALELAAILSQFLQIDEKENPCWSKAEKRALSVREMVDKLFSFQTA